MKIISTDCCFLFSIADLQSIFHTKKSYKIIQNTNISRSEIYKTIELRKDDLFKAANIDQSICLEYYFEMCISYEGYGI